MKDAETLAALYNTGIAAAFNSLAEAGSKEQAVTLLMAGAEATSCLGPEQWPPPEFREMSAERIDRAMDYLVFEQSQSFLRVRGTEVEWLRLDEN